MTVFTITFNEQLMLPFFIKHYRERFPNCKIVVYDNESTDNTVKIAKDNGCEVITYKTNNELDDLMYLTIKNTCWKNEKGWVIVADCDELVEVSDIDLYTMESLNITALKSQGYNMVNLEDNLEIECINNGVRAESYDKLYCFDARKIQSVNYNPGAHSCNPTGDVNYSDCEFICRHYKYINPDYMVERHKVFASRLSKENRRMGFGCHYLYKEKQIREEFQNARKNAQIV
jgi:glycosyltransferase involved in cell wall biosynthesis